MASIINATNTSSGIALTPDSSGVLALQAAGTTVATVSSTGVSVTGTLSTTGALSVTGNITTTGATGGIGYGPAFSAYQSLAQTLTSATWTKIQYQTKEFDTNSNFDNVTNFRFTPTVSGYYQVNGGFAVNVSATTITASFYKNGSRFKDIVNINTSAGAIYASTLIFLNGSTDYVELWGNIATGQALAASANQTYFQASLVRSA
jgi:hypothetical protein